MQTMAHINIASTRSLSTTAKDNAGQGQPMHANERLTQANEDPQEPTQPRRHTTTARNHD
jgi:hypothetical protein